MSELLLPDEYLGFAMSRQVQRMCPYADLGVCTGVCSSCTDNAFSSKTIYAGKIIKAIMNANGHP